HVGRLQLRSIVGDVRLWHVERFVCALDAQPLFAHSGQMPAAREELHVVVGGRKAPSEVSADSAGADYCNAHDCSCKCLSHRERPTRESAAGEGSWRFNEPSPLPLSRWERGPFSVTI